MESSLDMFMSFSSPPQTITASYCFMHMELVGKNIQNTRSCNYFFAVVFIGTLYNIYRDSFTNKSTEICTTFFHLTLVNLNAYLIFLLAIVTYTNDSSGCSLPVCFWSMIDLLQFRSHIQYRSSKSMVVLPNY